MLDLEIKISGKTYGDLESALKEIKRKVSQEFTSGFDRNDSGWYNFSITGEEEAEE